jgi:hypothetical protein
MVGILTSHQTVNTVVGNASALQYAVHLFTIFIATEPQIASPLSHLPQQLSCFATSFTSHLNGFENPSTHKLVLPCFLIFPYPKMPEKCDVPAQREPCTPSRTTSSELLPRIPLVVASSQFALAWQVFNCLVFQHQPLQAYKFDIPSKLAVRRPSAGRAASYCR